MTGRMRVRMGSGPFGPEWVVACPEHGAIAWVQHIWDADHRDAMNIAVGHVRDEHVFTCDVCWGGGFLGGKRSFVEGRMVDTRHPCDKCGGTGSNVLMGEPASPPTKSANS